ncbi:MAG: hypothetical protein MJ212_03510 [Alphaproteobacteria bacterium]|nr:hypothetical protein [Alphaproteobacteria bacterium]
MVNFRKILTGGICAAAILTPTEKALATEDEIITRFVTADACDERQPTDDKQTAENRAIDKASMAAIKLSGIVQKIHPELSASALDIISYRIIDEYLLNTQHRVTISDDTHICVNLEATVEITTQDIHKLVEEYQNSDATELQTSEIAEQINDDTSFKANTLQDKKLVYIAPMTIWNGEDTNHYTELLNNLLSHSDYFYITDNKDTADYTITPSLSSAKVDKIDQEHHKMQMLIELTVESRHDDGFEPINTKQNHFILFPATKNEQEIADTLITKLLSRATTEISNKIDRYLSLKIEKQSRGL